MYTCEIRINANLVKGGSFRINAKLVKEELSPGKVLKKSLNPLVRFLWEPWGEGGGGLTSAPPNLACWAGI